MIQDLWINLPVKNIIKSKAFFAALGFSFNTEHGNADNSACLLLGQKNQVVMLFDESTFQSFTNSPVSDTQQATEVLLSIGVKNKEAVDELAEKAAAAGGTTSHKPSQMQQWMYGCVFSDLDGHKWNVLYMDMSKMP